MSPVFIGSEQELRSVIKPPPAMALEKIESGPIRATPSEFLAAVRLAFITTVTDGGQPRVLLAGGTSGCISKDGASGDLLVPIEPSRRAEIAAAITERPFVGMLLTVPGVQHTLRVNGLASLRDDGTVLAVSPDQSYAHCAKAFIRSKVWTRPAAVGEAERAGGVGEGGGQEVAERLNTDRLNEECIEFIGSSPFGVLGTVHGVSESDGDGDADGESDADTSPRGDPPGFVRVLDEQQLFVPDRPGNRIVDSLRNIIANPQASLLLMTPGDPRTLEIAGDAHITADQGLCRTASVNGKVPKLGIVIGVRIVQLRTEPALVAADAWNQARHADKSAVPTIGAIVADPNGAASTTKRLLTSAANRMTAIDYKRNLY